MGLLWWKYKAGEEFQTTSDTSRKFSWANTSDVTIFLVYALLECQVSGSGAAASVPKELSHREAPFLQHRAEQLGQVQPDVGNVDGHVVRLLQRVCKPEKTEDTPLKSSHYTKYCFKPKLLCNCSETTVLFMFESRMQMRSSHITLPQQRTHAMKENSVSSHISLRQFVLLHI